MSTVKPLKLGCFKHLDILSDKSNPFVLISLLLSQIHLFSSHFNFLEFSGFNCCLFTSYLVKNYLVVMSIAHSWHMKVWLNCRFIYHFKVPCVFFNKRILLFKLFKILAYLVILLFYGLLKILLFHLFLFCSFTHNWLI